MIIENLMYLLFSYIAIAVLGLLCYLLIFIANVYEKSQDRKQRRAEIRSEFKREINELRADDGVFSEVYEIKERNYG